MLSKYFTLIKVSREVVAILKEIGHKQESYDEIIRRVLQKAGFLE
jgi:hypothetical protein